MLLGTKLYIAYSVIAIIIPSILAYLFWSRRKTIGALSMSLLMLCAIEWTFFGLLSAISIDYQTKVFWDNLTFIGVVFIPVPWIIFSIHYTRQEHFTKKYYYLLFCIIPLISLIILFIDKGNGFFIASKMPVQLPNSSISLITYQFGSWFWVHIVYSYGLMLAGILILTKGLINSIKIYRNQAIIMILAVFIPILGSLLYIFGLGPFEYLDPTTLTFSLAGLLLFIGMFRYKVFDLIPIAREAILETMEDLVIVLDMQNRIIDANSSARKTFSKQCPNLMGQPISNILSSFPSLADKSTLNSKSNYEMILEIEGEKIYYNVKVAPLLNKEKIVIGSFIMLMDITNLYKTMESLESAKQVAESASKAKSNFLATMSHEIRTPINGIIGMSELLESANLLPQEKENLRALQDSADSLLEIINEILDFSKIEAGKMDIENIGFNIRELIKHTVKAICYNNQKQHISFSSIIDDKIPNSLIGDSTKLRQILTNLLSNAYKFTEAGEVNVNVCIKHLSQEKVVLGFSVSDTGIGISEDKINSIFQSFNQLDSSTKRKYGGTGLGLSIVKRLVELMGGYIEVESTLGKGSKFYFEIPFKVVKDSFIVEAAATADINSSNKKLRILIGEDSRVNQLLITQLINKKGWVPDIAGNGRELIEKYECNTYDLILMDIQMPEMDGYEATEFIRSKEQETGSHIPIIALTANATLDDKALCLSHDMDDFLSKPIKSESLYNCILQHAKEQSITDNR